MNEYAYNIEIEENQEVPVSSPLSYLDLLNERQKEAVLLTDGSVLVLAGAGTGKTRVLTTRIVHLLNTGKASPHEILAVTFTNKAAAEMHERVNMLLGHQTEGWWIGTFHAIAVRILRVHAEKIGLQSNFNILDDDDQLRLIKQILKDEEVDEKKWPPRMVKSTIDYFKNRALLPEQIGSDAKRFLVEGKMKRIYSLYQERLKASNLCDFGDLLLHVIQIFKNHPEILEQYQHRFKYILVDEYQDTNVAQYLWLRYLAQHHKNLCCVGDDDQSIYGWRGAQVDNILRFEADFPGATIIRLEQNYRSTGHILSCAGTLIEKNKSRLGKTLWTESDKGLPVEVHSFWDGQEEARLIALEIDKLQRKGVSLSEIAVLVRAGYQTREFEERFLSVGLPYKVIGGLRFYERLEIRDAIAYFRLIVQPQDDLAFERIINTPKRGIGPSTLQLIHHVARSEQISLLEATDRLLGTDEFKPKMKQTLFEFVNNIKKWRDSLAHTKHVDVVQSILKDSGYIEMWRQDKSPEAPGRLENLNELINAIGEFETMQSFLEHISLVMDNASQTEQNLVTFMTLHAAKGLEFNVVFLPGWEEGVFPNPKAMEDNGVQGLEEERRLAYVGMTRARERLIISHVKNRRMYGTWDAMLPSRFLKELSASAVVIKGTQSQSNYQVQQKWSQQSYYKNQMIDKPPLSLEKKNRYMSEPADDFTASSIFEKGVRVFHQKFGYGVVSFVESDKVTVLFDKAGEKKVMSGFLVVAEAAGL